MRSIKELEYVFPNKCYVRSFGVSGVTFLMNIALELDIMTHFFEAISNSWKMSKEGCEIHPRLRECGIDAFLPALVSRKYFTFKDTVALHFSHDYPKEAVAQAKVILFVRDGRDALYSRYRKEFDHLDSFLETLRQPQFPSYLSMPNAWAQYNLIWIEFIPKHNLHIIRFEDIKSQPRSTVEKLLTFLGISRTDSEIQRAIDNSSFRKAQEHEQRMIKNVKNHHVVMRKGSHGEWMGVYGHEELSIFSGMPNNMLNKLGYDCYTANETDAFISNRIDLTKYRSVSGIKQALARCKDHNDILLIGGVLVCRDWLYLFGIRENSYIYDRMLNILLNMIPQVINDRFFQIQVAKLLSKNGERGKSLALIESILRQEKSQYIISAISVVLIRNKCFFKAALLLKNYGNYRFLFRNTASLLSIYMKKYNCLLRCYRKLQCISFIRRFFISLFGRINRFVYHTDKKITSL